MHTTTYTRSLLTLAAIVHIANAAPLLPAKASIVDDIVDAPHRPLLDSREIPSALGDAYASVERTTKRSSDIVDEKGPLSSQLANNPRIGTVVSPIPSVLGNDDLATDASSPSPASVGAEKRDPSIVSSVGKFGADAAAKGASSLAGSWLADQGEDALGMDSTSTQTKAVKERDSIPIGEPVESQSSSLDQRAPQGIFKAAKGLFNMVNIPDDSDSDSDSQSDSGSTSTSSGGLVANIGDVETRKRSPGIGSEVVDGTVDAHGLLAASDDKRAVV